MRRWLALFMLVLLPLLSGWSAAAAYCGDEPVGRPAHLGHHVDAHDHGNADAKPDNLKDGPADAHCDHCHSPGALLLPDGTNGQRADQAQPAPMPNVALRVPPKSPPDRPKWARLA
ncbi:hypothetical protein WKW80_09140 [Variovorax humicola]|uniref:DUF2946 domain-containing protein n=1 Tax=Variovorax humicola TaxID=1769758 RepID=A0ABU8VWQ9_9BURK